jgi:hypothetical protein
MEILLGKMVPLIGIDGFEKDLPVHKKCLEGIKPGNPWQSLPEGPLRREYARAFEKETA